MNSQEQLSAAYMSEDQKGYRNSMRDNKSALGHAADPYDIKANGRRGNKPSILTSANSSIARCKDRINSTTKMSDHRKINLTTDEGQ
jgi:hypothetical protein